MPLLRGAGIPPLLRIEGLTKRFGGFVALDGLDLEIGPGETGRGELFALLGASGCGKSTLLRCLAGLLAPDAGRVTLEGRDLAGVPAHTRPINMMFQSHALFPHMTVAQNIGFGVKQDGLARATIRDRVAEMLALVRLEGFGARRPDSLSGGQRARVALARALARRPKLLLLDEPLSALDRTLREAMQFELMAIRERTGTTFILVTHDQVEAMTMATRLAVMDRGRLVQVGAPAEVYEHPRSRFCAQFLGAANILEGVVTACDGTGFRLDGAGFAVAADGTPPAGARAAVAIRPERMRIAPASAAPGHDGAVGRLRDIGFQGDRSLYRVALEDGAELRVIQPGLPALQPGDSVVVSWDRSAVRVLEA